MAVSGCGWAPTRLICFVVVFDVMGVQATSSHTHVYYLRPCSTSPGDYCLLRLGYGRACYVRVEGAIERLHCRGLCPWY